MGRDLINLNVLETAAYQSPGSMPDQYLIRTDDVGIALVESIQPRKIRNGNWVYITDDGEGSDGCPLGIQQFLVTDDFPNFCASITSQ